MNTKQNNDVFVVIIEDRHSDVGVEVWTDRDSAIERAKALAKEYAGYNDCSPEQKTVPGWEYYTCYSCEGDCVRVVRVKVQ